MYELDEKEFAKTLLQDVEDYYYYTAEQAARIFGCSPQHIRTLCRRSAAENSQKGIDSRHLHGLRPEGRYTGIYLAKRWNVSLPLISKLRWLGELKSVTIHRRAIFPGFAVFDFIHHNASPAGSSPNFMNVATCVRIPGWAIKSMPTF